MQEQKEITIKKQKQQHYKMESNSKVYFHRDPAVALVEGEDDPNWALIGTTGYGQNLQKTVLEKRLMNSQKLPTNISRFLGSRPWTRELNEEWIHQMVEEKRSFILTHKRLQAIWDGAPRKKPGLSNS
jgi:hypothetical protein